MDGMLLTWPVADFLYAWRVSSFLSGKLIILILFVFSIFAWTVMISKAVELRLARTNSLKFLHAFRREEHPLGLFVRRQTFAGSPLASVYESACKSLGVELDEGEGEDALRLAGKSGATLNSMQIGVVRNAAERRVADQQLVLESRMGTLSLAVTISPLLGLLGTVWGVLDAFSQMALQGVANLSAVAPGIASALLTTVVGLLVAIPSAVGYNMLVSKIRELMVQTDNYADELMAEVQRAFLRE